MTEREAPGGSTFSWAYDQVSNQVRQTDADDGHTYYDFDPANRLSVIRDPFGGSYYFEYDTAGRLISKQLPSGAVTYQGYDEASRVSQVLHAKSDGSVIASYDTTRDSRGNPTRITDENGDYREFQYDSLSRLIAEKWYDVGDTLLDRKVYFYDAAYNRIREDFEGGPTVYYLYDARNAPTEIRDTDGNVTYLEYGAAGSLTSETTDAGTAYYEWNAEEMLQRADLAAGGHAYYDYDGDARRWSKQDSGGTKRYRWDVTRGGEPGLAVVQEADGGGTTTGSYTHDQGATIMPGVGTILSVREDSTDHFFHTDAQGTTRLLTDADEATAASYDLDAWGVQRSHTGAFSTPYLFTGKERDANTLLDYFLARQYRPQWGAFVTRDPMWPGERMAFGYAAMRPLVLFDPDGREYWDYDPPRVIWDVKIIPLSGAGMCDSYGKTECWGAGGAITGELTVTIWANNACLAQCKREHESVHVIQMTNCCELYGLCMRVVPTADRRIRECILPYAEWHAANEVTFEVDALRASVECLEIMVRYGSPLGDCDCGCLQRALRVARRRLARAKARAKPIVPCPLHVTDFSR